MELSTVVGIIVIVAVAVLLLKVIGKVFSFVLSIVGVVAVVWLVIAGLRYLDEQDLRNKLVDSNNLFLLEDGSDIITGFATQDEQAPDMTDVKGDLTNPNSELYENYYKVIVVKKEDLPEKTSLVMDVSDDSDKLGLFRSYVEKRLIGENFADNLINMEKEGNVSVYKETIAFKHGLGEVLSP